MTGEAPESFSSLINLKKLLLFSTAVSGSIPDDWSAMHQIEMIALQVRKHPEITLSQDLAISAAALSDSGFQANRLSGTIANRFNNFTLCTALIFSSNQISGTVSAGLAALTGGQLMFWHANRLSGEIPSELSGMEKVAILSLNNNALSSTLPESLATLSDLEVIAGDDLAALAAFSLISECCRSRRERN